MANLLDLPEEVLESSILPHLPWNDLLRCRRVCKTIKDITDDYLRLNPQKAPEIEVTENDAKNLKAFIDMGIPTTKLFLNNPNGHHFYDNLDTATLTNFATIYGPLIRSLRVVEFSVYPCFNERTFLEALSHLKAFEAGYYGWGVEPTVDQRREIEFDHLIRAKSDPRFTELYHPQNLTDVEVLKIGHNKQCWIGDNNNRLYIILATFEKLDYISYPFCCNVERNVEAPVINSAHPTSGTPLYYMLEKISAYIFARYDDDMEVEGQKNLKFFDFINYHFERELEIEVLDEMRSEQSLNFLCILIVCNKFGVKLLNVNPAWYHLRTHPNARDLNLPVYGHPVVSLVNLHACVLTLDMPNLEKINICQTSRSNVSPFWNERPDWPALKILEINVNSKKAVETETPEQDTALLFKFLWKDIVRGQLTELSLKFQDGKGKEAVAIPKTEDIVSACPNLRKLRIKNWPGTNKQLTKLWSGLPGLKELALEYCKDLGNVAFVGDDVKNPVFFRLKSLKKFTLKGLDQMPKITDTLFSLVLAKMKLSHLIIGSDKPIQKITRVGLAALLEGKLAETIEKFPFHEWSLANMSAEEFKEVAKGFRSSDMI